jgi:hypothetical protein
MEYIETYLDDLSILTNNSFKDQLSISGMRVNISKSTFFTEQIESLRNWVLDFQISYSIYIKQGWVYT